MSRIFISHSNNDHALAMEVCALLEARGLPCWIGPRDVVPGKVWDEAILDAIDSTSIFLLLLSSAANSAPFVKNEVNRAFTLGKPILTFRIEDVQPGRSLELYLARHHWTDGFSGRIEDRVSELAKAIETLPIAEAPMAPGAAAGARTGNLKPKLRTLSSRRERLAWGVAAGCAVLALAAVAVLISGWRPGDTTRLEPIIATIDSPEDATPLHAEEDGAAAISPDGRRVVFPAISSTGERQLFVRDLSTATTRGLPGTTGGYYPFWSPDGSRIGFFGDGKLKTLDLRGSTSQVIADAAQGRGGSWSRDDTIVFAGDIRSGLFAVPAAGGTPREVTRAEAVSHRWPAFLPDGKHFLYLSIVSGSMGTAESALLMLGSLEGDAPRTIVVGASNAQYVEPGYLLFGRQSDLFALKFDPSTLAPVGEPLPIPLAKVAAFTPRGLASFSASDSGALLYQPSEILERGSRLLWVDRSGNLQGSIGPVDRYIWPRISPDGSKIAFVVGKIFDASSLWVADLRDGRRTRLSRDNRGYQRPIWTPDSRRIVVACRVKDVGDLCIKSLDDGADMRMIYSSMQWKDPGGVLADGRTLMYAEQFDASDYDVMKLDLVAPKPTPTTIFKGNGGQDSVDVSPDGQWLAYVSNESGNREVYVRPASGSAQQWQISTAGGLRPRWTRGGSELLYAAPNGDLMSVQILDGNNFRAASPKALFRMPEYPGGPDRPVFEDVTADGERLLLNVPTIPSSTYGFRIVVNWPGLLKQSDPR